MIDELATPILHVCMMSLVRRAAEKRQQEPGNGGCAGGVRGRGGVQCGKEESIAVTSKFWS